MRSDFAIATRLQQRLEAWAEILEIATRFAGGATMSLMDDDRPQKKTVHEIGSDLSMLSVDELRARVELLKTEIARLEAEAAKKASGRLAAENLFRS
jgi:uncharacterized small protein (DUF1192 family)